MKESVFVGFVWFLLKESERPTETGQSVRPCGSIGCVSEGAAIFHVDLISAGHYVHFLYVGGGFHFREKRLRESRGIGDGCQVNTV